MKLLITGVNGMLGRTIYKLLSTFEEYEIYGSGRSEPFSSKLNGYFKGDLCDESFVQEVSSIKYDFIIHCAAIVSLKVCEEDYSLANDTHVVASKSLAASNSQAVFIYISTDSIFDGSHALMSEMDCAKPLNNYAKTKYLGGEAVRRVNSKSYELRLNIYGFKMPLAGSFFEWIYDSLTNGKPIDGYDNVSFNPLYVGQVAKVILRFIENKPEYGIYNLGSEKPISKYEFIMRVAKKFVLDSNLVTKAHADFDEGIIQRPYNTLLNTNKLLDIFPDLDLSLKSGLSQLKNDIEDSFKLRK